MNVSSDKLKLGLQEVEIRRNTREYESGKHKLGRILTVVDSAIADPEQRKATKDIVNSIWYEGQHPLNSNSSDEAMLFEALTGDELWDTNPDTTPNPVAKRYNPFEEKLNK